MEGSQTKRRRRGGIRTIIPSEKEARRSLRDYKNTLHIYPPEEVYPGSKYRKKKASKDDGKTRIRLGRDWVEIFEEAN